MTYDDKDGKQHTCVKGLAPALEDRFGNSLKKDEIAKEIAKKKIDAMRLWNVLDCSVRASTLQYGLMLDFSDCPRFNVDQAWA